MEQDRIRLYYRFYGTVQGVGFRWQVMNVARKYQLTGRVKNLSDGTVEAEVQGPSTSIQSWFTEVYQDRYSKIQNVEVSEISIRDGESDFYVETSW